MENSFGVLQVIGTLPRFCIINWLIVCKVMLRRTKILATFFMQRLKTKTSVLNWSNISILSPLLVKMVNITED